MGKEEEREMQLACPELSEISSALTRGSQRGCHGSTSDVDGPSNDANDRRPTAHVGIQPIHSSRVFSSSRSCRRGKPSADTISTSEPSACAKQGAMTATVSTELLSCNHAITVQHRQFQSHYLSDRAQGLCPRTISDQNSFFSIPYLRTFLPLHLAFTAQVLTYEEWG